LQLLEGLSGIDALVLPGVANEQHPVLRPDLFEKRLHLPGAGETGLVEHIEVPGVRVSGAPLYGSASQKTLQSVGLNAGIPELAELADKFAPLQPYCHTLLRRRRTPSRLSRTLHRKKVLDG
jgi:hypothetical protein